MNLPQSAPGEIERVLLVDAAVDEREMYAVALRAHGYDVRESGDGEDALVATRVNMPNVIVADVTLPKVDGLHLLAAVRADVVTRDIPFIMLTGHDQPLDVIADAKTAGATSVRIKPCLPQTLVDDIDNVLRRSRVTRERAETARLRSQAALDRSRAVLTRAIENAVRLCPTCGAPLNPSGVVRLSVGHTYYRPCSSGCGWWYFDGPARQLRKLI
jgi:DNA-binding response OmpR family regulator